MNVRELYQKLGRDIEENYSKFAEATVLTCDGEIMNHIEYDVSEGWLSMSHRDSAEEKITEENKTLKVRYEKVVTSAGKRCMRILKLDGLEYNDLPEMYINDNNNVVLKDTKLVSYNSGCNNPGNYTVFFREGEEYSVKEFDSVMLFLDGCVNKLREVNAYIKDMKSEWCGEETVEL